MSREAAYVPKLEKFRLFVLLDEAYHGMLKKGL